MAMKGRDVLARDLSKPGFNADAYVSGLSQGGEDDLLETKQTMQLLAEDTAQSLKKNVYKNYTQFIETAKEISILEGEMYQLSHMLTDQKSRMTAMMEMSLTSDKAVVETPKEEKETVNLEEETRRNLAFLLEKVEGCSTIADVPGRQLIHNGDLIEVDPEHYTQGRRVHAFLLNDSLMIANWLDIKHGPVRYRFEGLYELDSLAVVNVRDVGPLKNAFKILMFPHHRMFQADSSKSRRQWLDILEDTKKRKVARDKQRRDTLSRLPEQQEVAKTPTSPERSNPFDSGDESDALMAMETDMLNVDWLQELPEDLDMCIAQRDFEGSVDLVEKVNNYLQDCPRTPAVKEFQARIDHRVKQLTEGLRSELQVSPERSLRGGPRAARRAVLQLIRLGKSAQACELFLKNRSAIIKYNIRQLKFEGATTLYIKRLCAGFFTSLEETGREFRKAFPEHYGCYSAFVLWSSEELRTFVGIFSRQVFGGKSIVSTIAECVQLARQQCDKLSNAGLELGFILDSLIAPDVLRVIEESRDQLIEAVKHRANDDLWRPLNHVNEVMLKKFVEEMKSAGVTSVDELVYDECWVGMTMNVALFAKSSLSFVDDMMKFMTPELKELIIDAIVKLYTAELAHFNTSLKSDKFLKDHAFIVKNAEFIQQALLSKTVNILKQEEVTIPKQFILLQEDYARLKRVAKVS